MMLRHLKRFLIWLFPYGFISPVRRCRNCGVVRSKEDMPAPDICSEECLKEITEREAW